MIICAQCGGRNEDNENFCGVCGSYLEWDGSRVEPARAAAGGPAAAETTAPAAPAAPAATPSPTPGPSPSPGPASNGNGPPPDPQVVAPVNPSVSQPVPPSVTQPAPPPVTGAQAPTAPTVPLQPVPPAPPVPPTARPATDRSAPPPPVTPSPPVPPPAPEMPVVPAQQPGAQRPGAPQRPGSQQPGGQQPGAQQPGAQQPGAQRPGAAQARRRQYVDEAVDEPPPDPGDLICGQCGAGNVPTRRFCRRCGNSLADAPVAGKKSWWRRLLDWFNRDGRRYQAGHRRKVRLPSRLRKLILLVLVVAVGGFLVLVPGRGPIRSGVNMVRDQLGKHVEVTPARAEASSTAPGSSPQQVIDGATNTFWAPAARGDSAVGGWVQTEFANPVRLLDVIVHPGVAPDRPTFLTEGRPKALRITVTSKSGKVTNKDITLPDVQGSHRYSIKASDAVTVRFTLLSAYGAQVGRVVAIAELEFFVRG